MDGGDAQVKPYYDEDGIRIYHADCRDVLWAMPPCDLLLTDPPYSEKTHAGARTITNGEAAKLVNFDAVDAELLASVFSLIQPKRWLISFMDYKHIAQLDAAPPTGLRFVRFGVWVKPNGAPQFQRSRI